MPSRARSTFAVTLTSCALLAACAAPPAERARAPQPSPEGAAGVYDIAAVEVKPRLINATAVMQALEQNYPPGLRDAGIGGTVTLRFIVGADGHTRDVQVTVSSDPGFSAPAAAVVRAMRFRPATVNGRAVSARVTLPVMFATSP